ncbi:MAG: nucleoside-diphosphate kinase [Flavobacteriaceae bacterium]|jgi:nucleoside-diphosphate kinase|tara:strand:+ start:38 stop:454 length:417 start_codon:yes stop_codon:yes gene_type:complete
MSNITFTMLKPDSVRNGNIGAILDKIIKSGFKIKAMKFTKMSNEKAGDFYAIHRERPFFNDLIEYMTSGPIVAAILEKENAVNDFRDLIGSTNPEDAEAGTIRKMFAKSISENAIHGSDSDENAKIECEFHFSSQEIF